MLGARKLFRMIYGMHISTLQLHHLAKLVECFSGPYEFSCEGLAFRDRMRCPTELKHPRRQFETEFAQIVRALVSQYLENLNNFQSISDVPAKGLVHIGNQGNHRLTHTLA